MQPKQARQATQLNRTKSQTQQPTRLKPHNRSIGENRKMSISAKDVKALRDATGAGMMDAKKALVECDGDMDAATQLLREKGLAKAAARSDRDNDEGTIALAAADNVAAIVQIKTETDFSAKSDAVTSLASAIADDVLMRGPGAANEHSAAIEDLRVKIKENVELGTVERIEGAQGNTIDTYLHSQDGRGVNAVVVEGSGVSRDDLHQVALHIAFAKPSYLSSDEVPAAEADKERTSLLEITKAEGKPEQAWDKIVDGRMRGWYAERVLLEQGLHGDKITVKSSLGGGSIARFVQVVIGT
ncbi:MAG: translation elongation factor Ts [Acidimicrobiaceae bacterium]|nr:translation elongation factor Ts [Acidimicrobiaceae bacterium]MYG54364.1 translation elongation factor Ts [Acidimicrobiaceae bacterium]MYJ98020.1 translation elongation factor Ts [Acidimicrobiaceae bacterium]